MSDQDSESHSHEGIQPLSQQLNLDAHQSAPAELKSFFKSYMTASEGEVLIDNLTDTYYLPGFESIPKDQVEHAFDFFRLDIPQLKVPTRSADNTKGQFLSRGWGDLRPHECGKPSPRWAFAFKQIPGLILLPGLLPDEIQIHLLNRLLHRDLFNPAHKTNLHTHYNMVYPEEYCSYFATPLAQVELQPKDPKVHKPLSIKQALERKLRWMTLGGQYDWTKKMYPTEVPPEFPKDIQYFIQQLFPDMEPQAAIVNIYSPGDKLMMHRDVSEEVDQGLVSISLGCSCIFIIGIEDEVTKEVQKLAIRLRSGDVIYMTGESRLAWHGVARIEKDTCPAALKKWPDSPLKEYIGWMASKRINLNVRQVREMTKDGLLPILRDSHSSNLDLSGTDEE